MLESSSQKANPSKEKIPLSTQIFNNIITELDKIHTPKLFGLHTYPVAVKFETQAEKETIILLMRRHIITNLPWVFIAFILGLAPFLAPLFGIFAFFPAQFQFMTAIIWYLFVLAYILENFLSWYFNVYIITDERVIDVDFYSLIYKRISECKLEKIEDVTYTQGGLLPSLFNYGDINIQTAAEITEFEFSAIPQPAMVAKVLNQLIQQEEQEKIEGRVS